MEAFSLLRYWRTNATTTTTATATTTADDVKTSTATSATIVTAVSAQTSERGDNEEGDDNDHGPFFDLEFSLPAEGVGDNERAKEDGETEEEDDEGDSDGSDDELDDDEEEDERELKFTMLSGTSSGGSTTDANVSVSPSDELFFKGGFVPVHQMIETNSGSNSDSGSNSKPPQFRVSLMKSATKFRVMMLKFNNKKPKNADMEESSNSKEEEEEEGEKSGEDSGKSTTVKFKIEEVPIVSLFKRHNSSKKAPKKRESSEESSVSDEKKFSKEAMQRYLRKVKPLYVRVSKRYGEKLKLSSQLNLAPSPEEQKPSPAAANAKREKESTVPEASEPPLLVPSNGKGLKQGNLPAGLRVVCKHLGKSRSAASTAVVAASPPPSTVSVNRRDDSLLQQQDGIQSAILHCKRSFKASRDSDCSSRSSSSAYGKCLNNWSSEETEKGDDCGQKAGI